MAVEIFIARHGQNQDNANGILNGHRDLPLTELGRQQACVLAEGIKNAGLKFQAVYSSPLKRAYDTALIVSQIVGIKEDPVVIPELIERDFGFMTGKPISDIEKLCSPNIIKADVITYFLSPKGGETFPQLMIRSEQALEKVRSMQTTGKALIVCHGDLGKMIYAAATGKKWQKVLTDFHFGNAELIAISSSDKVHIVEIEQYNH